jgi:hypothetical protein
VPRVLVRDGEGAIGRWRAGRPELTGDFQAFRGTLGAKVVVCGPAEAKGLAPAKTARGTTAEIAFLTQALKAPTLRVINAIRYQGGSSDSRPGPGRRRRTHPGAVISGDKT